MSLVAPPPVPSVSPATQLYRDLREERSIGHRRFPPGVTNFNPLRAFRFNRDPVAILLDAYERFGPVFTLRVFHSNIIFALGPEANHTILVSKADHFSRRESHYSSLLPLLGDGLLTIDGSFHHRSRRIMLPAFHREQIAATLDTMEDEINRTVTALRPGETLDLAHWAREFALRIAMRALFGLDPDRARAEIDAAQEFENALGFWGKDYVLQLLRGPGTPWAQMVRSRKRLDQLIYGEIQRRRRTGERGPDLLSLLLDAQDEDGTTLSDDHVRDEIMTLMFAGHDTTTATVCFMAYELDRAPHERALLQAECAALPDDRPGYETLMNGGLPRLEMALEETLRLWPPAWVGPRRVIKETTIAGVTLPVGAHLNYVSWASHRLPDVWERPDSFEPDRFSPERKAQIPKGAYVPFGGGSRTCIGMRFAQMEIKAIMSRILRDFTFELEPGWQMKTSLAPTIGPRSTMPVTVRAAR